MDREIRIYTGYGGYDLIMEMMENEAGLKRLYAGWKLPRILNKKKFKEHRTKGYYKLIRK